MFIDFNRTQNVIDDVKKARKFVRDCYLGESRIKSPQKRKFYLPPTGREEREEIDRGTSRKKTRYETRVEYAVFPGFLESTILSVVGAAQENEPEISLGPDSDNDEAPKEVRDLVFYGNEANDTIKGLKQRLNLGQALFGRYAMLLDVATDDSGLNPKFYISEYEADDVIDGEEGEYKYGRPSLKWVLLDETRNVFDETSKLWRSVDAYRVLGIDENGVFYQAELIGDAESKWRRFDLKNPDSVADNVVRPSFKSKTLDFIPFTVCNVDRLGVDSYQMPPYLDVARIAVACYRRNSFYGIATMNFASPTLLIKNSGRKKRRIYLGDALLIDSKDNNSDAKILETQGNGLEELRLSVEQARSELANSSIRELLNGAGANSSERALSLRVASGTSKIALIDSTGGRAIEEQLVFAYVWSKTATDKRLKTTDAFDEAGKYVKFKPDTTYLASDCKISDVSQLISVDSASPSPILSNKSKYALVNAASGYKLPSYDENVKQQESENVGTTATRDAGGTGVVDVKSDESDLEDNRTDQKQAAERK